MHSRKNKWYAVVLLLGAVISLSVAHAAWAQDKKPNILVIMGDDVGLVQHRRLSPGNHVGQDAEPRQACRPGHEVHRLLRRGKLHGGARQFHHRRAAAPHGLDDRRPGGRRRRIAGSGRHPRHRPQGAGLRNRASSARTISAI